MKKWLGRTHNRLYIYSNLQSVLLRCRTRPYEWSILSDELIRVGLVV